MKANLSHEGVGFEAERWQDVVRTYRRVMGLALDRKNGRAELDKGVARPPMNNAEALAA